MLFTRILLSSNGRLIDWLDALVHWFTSVRMIDLFIDLIRLSPISLAAQWIGWLIDCSIDRVIDWLIDWLIERIRETILYRSLCYHSSRPLFTINEVFWRSRVSFFFRVSVSGLSDCNEEPAEMDTFEPHDSLISGTCTVRLLFYGPSWQKAINKTCVLFQACRSFAKASNGLVTYGDDGDLWYLTLQYPHNPEVFTFLRQACVRSLSSEVRSMGFIALRIISVESDRKSNETSEFNFY